MSDAVNAADLELQKENVLPLRGGRDPALLKQKSAFSERAKQEVFRQQQEQHLACIEAAAGEPERHMEAWSEYISWARQALMNGGRKNEYAVILNDCITHCKRYREDYRFLKVCAEFVDFCDKPFAFLGWMESNDIGLCYSLFWETKARLLEDCSHDTAAADKAFDDGIRRNAQPISRLKERRKDLHARVAANMHSGASSQPLDDENARGGRRALGALERTDGTSRVAFSGPGQLRSEIRPGNARSRVEVFDGNEERDQPKDQWLAYGSEREAIKENKDMARQWTRVKLPQTPNYTKKPEFEIFDESADHEAADEAEPVIRPFSLTAQEKPAAAKDKQTVSRIEQKSVPAPLVASPITKRKQRAGFNEEALQGETLSFEELRAVRWFAANRAEAEERRRLAEEAEELARMQEDLKSKKMLNRAEMSFAIDINSTLDTMNYEALVRGSAKTTNLDAIDDLRNVYADTIDLENHLRGPAKLVREPTINTRAVMDEVEQMFKDELAFQEPVSADYGINKVAAPALADGGGAGGFEIYEDEDSLESFRASMNASAAASALSMVKPVATQSAAKLEIFCDDSISQDLQPISARVNISKNLSTSSAYRPMSPISEGSASHGSEDMPAVQNDPWSSLEGSALDQRLARAKDVHRHDGTASYEEDGKYLNIGDAVYDLSEKLGGSKETRVYRAEDVVESDDEPTSCIKIFRPAQAWEFYVASQLPRRCPNSVSLRNFVRTRALHIFEDESVMIMGYNSNGTMARMIDVWNRRAGGVPEELALFYAVELLQIVELVHSMRLLHNDICLGNLMLVVEADNVVDDQSIQLVDFGCALDLTDFATIPTVFRGTSASGVVCPEMQRNETWCFQPDYFGAANVIHALLFAGESIEVTRARRGGRLEPAKKSPSPMWEELFAALLNGPAAFTSAQYRDSAEWLRAARAPLQAELKNSAELVKKKLAAQNILLFEEN